jgi:hypothetical protein
VPVSGLVRPSAKCNPEHAVTAAVTRRALIANALRRVFMATTSGEGPE